MPAAVPGSPAAVLSAVLCAPAAPAYNAADPTQRRMAVFASTSAPDLPSLITDVVFMPANAELDANISVTGTVNGAEAVTAGVVTLTYAASLTPNATLGNHHRCTLTGNVTLNGPSGGVDGQKLTVELIQDGTGGRTFTAGTGLALGTDISSVTLTTTANKRDFLALIYDVTTGLWYVVGVVRGY